MTNGPSTRPAEWTVAVVGVVTAILAYQANHDTAVLTAAVLGALPVLLTAIFVAVHFPAKYHPTEVVTAVVGVITAIVLYSQNHDVAGLNAALMAFVPALITIFAAPQLSQQQPDHGNQ